MARHQFRGQSEGKNLRKRNMQEKYWRYRNMSKKDRKKLRESMKN